MDIKNCQVFGIDHIEELVNKSIENIKKNNSYLFDNQTIQILTGDGRNGLLSYAPFDFIHVGAALDIYPKVLLRQLNNGGRLFIPIKESVHNEYINIFDKEKSGNIVHYKTLPVVNIKFNMFSIIYL